MRAALLKRCSGGGPVFNEKEIPAAIELAYDLLDLSGPHLGPPAPLRSAASTPRPLRGTRVQAVTRENPQPTGRVLAGDEVLARATNPLIGRAAFETAKRMYPRDLIEYRRGV
jgi:hypothetical protein